MKPVFLTKAQREALAAQKKARENEEYHKRLQSEKELRDALKEQQQSALKQQKTDQFSHARTISKDSFNSSLEKKTRKCNERHFVFDWDASEDTSVASIAEEYSIKPPNPLIQPKATAASTNDDNYRIQKSENQHWTQKHLSEMKERDWRIFLEDFSLSISTSIVSAATTNNNRFSSKTHPPAAASSHQPQQIIYPIRSWTEAEQADLIHLNLLNIIMDEMGFEEPTPIQRASIPIVQSGCDLLGIAQTGSGKTMAFLLPIISALMFERERGKIHSGTSALILAPSRELALQICKEAKELTKGSSFQCMAIVGGHDMSEQEYFLSKGVDLLVATPGRLVDTLEQGMVDLSRIRWLVLDEADRMVELGFEEDLLTLVCSLPKQYRQTFLFSATMPTAVEKLTRAHLQRPMVVRVGTYTGTVPESVHEMFSVVPSANEKKTKIIELLQRQNNLNSYPPPIIIFVNRKETANALVKQLESSPEWPPSYSIAVLHGGKRQEQREASIKDIKSGNRQVLIATDVAARGLDVNNLSLVINYDFPKSKEDYVHRVGRTGRAGRHGTAITLMTLEESESELAIELKRDTKNKKK